MHLTNQRLRKVDKLSQGSMGKHSGYKGAAEPQKGERRRKEKGE